MPFAIKQVVDSPGVLTSLIYGDAPRVRIELTKPDLEAGILPLNYLGLLGSLLQSDFTEDGGQKIF